MFPKKPRAPGSFAPMANRYGRKSLKLSGQKTVPKPNFKGNLPKNKALNFRGIPRRPTSGGPR